jgi:hypothetical protein
LSRVEGLAKAPSEAAKCLGLVGLVVGGCGGRRSGELEMLLFKGGWEDGRGYLNKEEDRKGSMRRNEARSEMRRSLLCVQSS